MMPNAFPVTYEIEARSKSYPDWIVYGRGYTSIEKAEQAIRERLSWGKDYEWRVMGVRRYISVLFEMPREEDI